MMVAPTNNYAVAKHDWARARTTAFHSGTVRLGDPFRDLLIAGDVQALHAILIQKTAWIEREGHQPEYDMTSATEALRAAIADVLARTWRFETAEGSGGQLLSAAILEHPPVRLRFAGSWRMRTRAYPQSAQVRVEKIDQDVVVEVIGANVDAAPVSFRLDTVSAAGLAALLDSTLEAGRHASRETQARPSGSGSDSTRRARRKQALERLRTVHDAILARRGGEPFDADEIDSVIEDARAGEND